MMAQSMIFNKDDMQSDGAVRADVVMERITAAIEDNLVYEEDFDNVSCMNVSKAEQLLLGLKELLDKIT